MWRRFLTPLHRADGDEEALLRRLAVQVAEDEAEAVVTFEPGAGGVRVPQAVELHVVLGEVLTRTQIGPTSLGLSQATTSPYSTWTPQHPTQIGRASCRERVSSPV